MHVYDVFDDGLECSMIWLICIGLLSIAVVGAVLFAEHEAAEDERVAREIEDDWNYFLQTGDDAGYRRRMKK